MRYGAAMLKYLSLLLLLVALGAGCGWSDPTDEQLTQVANEGKAMLLTNESSNRFLAVHKDGDTWTLYPLTAP